MLPSCPPCFLDAEGGQAEGFGLGFVGSGVCLVFRQQKDRLSGQQERQHLSTAHVVFRMQSRGLPFHEFWL